MKNYPTHKPMFNEKNGKILYMRRKCKLELNKPSVKEKIKSIVIDFGIFLIFFLFIFFLIIGIYNVISWLKTLK